MRRGLPERGSIGDGARLMRLGIAVGLVVAIAGCGKSSQPGENQSSANEKSIAPSENGVAEASRGNAPSSSSDQSNAPAASNSPGTLPRPSAALRFVGTWAHSRAECGSRPWRFTAEKISAAGGPNCSIYKVSEAPGGYDLAANCPAKTPEPTDLIKLRFAESASAMLVESNAISPTGLVYCGK
jgi:hypothetical protein